METKTGRAPPKGKDVLIGWCVICSVAFLGVAFCLPGEDPMRAAIWAGATSAAAGLGLASWWALGYEPPHTDNENERARLATMWEHPFIAGAALSAVSWFLVAPAYAQGRSPFSPWWCIATLVAFAAAGVVIHTIRGRAENKRLLAFVVCMGLWTVLMLIGQQAMNTGFERPLIGVVLGAGGLLYLFKPWLKD